MCSRLPGESDEDYVERMLRLHQRMSTPCPPPDLYGAAVAHVLGIQHQAVTLAQRAYAKSVAFMAACRHAPGRTPDELFTEVCAMLKPARERLKNLRSR